jgi:DNA-binding CsgD family transcriptional regulator
VIIDEEAYLEHYGILRKSGRYPWGSGGTQSARNQTFLSTIEKLKNDGLSETEIARGYGITTTQLRAARSIARNQQKQEQIGQAQRLKDKGYSNVAIGRRMGINESSVRALLAPGEKDKIDVLQTTANMLKGQVEKKDYIDIGVGVENHLGISQTKLKTAVAMLEEEGYKIRYVKVQQLGTGEKTTIKVLSKEDSPFPKAAQIKQITDFSEDGGRTFFGLQPPISISSKRIHVRYAEEGGTDADGVIFVRPGTKDLSLGQSHYAQVRIAVDGTHYLKGMAMYKDDLPDGVDIVFNTNKSNTGRKLDAMKEMKDDPDNPFGAIVRQRIEVDAHGKQHVTSAMNIVNEEGDWGGWSKSLSSQMLSKQDPKLARSQLNMTYERRANELDEIMRLTNPVVKKKLLETYADATDSAAVHLKAAALPRQASHVILPVKSMNPKEIFAPNYRNGESVVLVRYPHGGTFEIPRLTVNNKHVEARKLIGAGAKDAVGIHPKVAERLSGADFDGDTVLVIPNNKGLVKTSPPLEGLKGFDPQSYKIPEGSGIPHIKPARKQQEMGNVTNLIADMTIHGASSNELARAVRHSMVVIDSEKHGLDWKRSAADNGIAQLKAKYQGGPRAGASTLITKAGSEIRVPERKPRSAAKGGPIDTATGRRVYEPTGASYVNRAGKTVLKTTKSQKLAEVDDAFKLSSGTPMETVYAEHANKLKALANTARKESVAIRPIKYSPSAKQTYASQVASLDAKLNVALKNRPLERQAQVLANTVVSLKRQANPEMDVADLSKVKAQALNEARTRTGAKKQQIVITQEEWHAIQAGAISTNKLTQIINNSDLDTIKKLATPRAEPMMTSSKLLRAQSMKSSGYTQAEIADALGVSLSTLKASISE